MKLLKKLIFCCLSNVPQIKTESIFLRKRIFSWQKRATKGSCFFALEKNVLWKNLEVESWNWQQKNR
jgi:hypothetical protein